jgi:dTDP-4-dehydrorhamnose 3,5-epimerase-like enzyme
MKNILTVKHSGFIVLRRIEDGADGTISVAEYNKNIPFEIKRVYYIYELNNADAVRGKHAHKELQQVLFCINGSCKIGLDDGASKQDVVLDKPNIGILLGTELWHTMKDFSDNCILLVLASDVYDEDDYIRDYDLFIEYVNRDR